MIIGILYTPTYASASYVIFGKSSELTPPQGGNNNFYIVDRYGDIGFSVSSAGDINDDGFDDVIVGGREIASYVIFGKASGFGDRLELINLDSDTGFSVTGESAHGSVSDAGDVNGDGIDDFIVGSSVIFGRTSGFGASLDVASLDGSNGFRLNGSDGPISSAGDVNGDGIDDVIAGGADIKGDGSGSSYVVFGKTSGFGATLDLTTLDENAGFRLDGAAAGDQSGFSVSSAGDVNGDGFDDLIVGAPKASPNGITGAGSSYVIFGRSDFGGGGGNVIAGTPGDDVLKGTSGADIFEAGDGNDLMVGRGGADVFKAGAGNDKITVTDLDFASVAGGAGNDVLHLAGNGLNLDLADFGSSISGIETFCLFGQGDNTLTLTAAGLLHLSDTSNTLKVNGNAAGHIIVEDSGWVDGGPRGSGYYHVYTNEDAVLLVGQNITVDFT